MDVSKTQYKVLRVMRWGYYLLLLFFIFFLLIYSWLSWQGVKKEQTNALSSISELSGNSLNAYFLQYENSFGVLAQSLKFEHGGLDIPYAHHLLKLYLQANPDLQIVNINRPDGQLLLSTEALPRKKLPTQAKAPSYIAGLNELEKGARFNVGRPTYGPLAKNWVMPLRYAVRGKQGELLYVLVAVLPLSKQQNFWRDLSLPQNTALGLLGDDAYLISRYPDSGKTDYAELYGKPRTGILVEYLFQHSFPQRGMVEGFNSAAKEDYLFSYRRLSNYPMTLFVATPISNVYLKWWQQVQYTYLLLLVFNLGMYFVYRWTSSNQLAWELEREQSEQTLKSTYAGLLASEERFRRVASEAPFPMMIHAEDGEVLDINKAWSEATGYTHEDIPTITSWLRLAYGEHMQAMRNVVERMYGIEKRIDQGERLIRCKDGRLRTWHFSAAPVGKLPDGRRYVVSMAQDVSGQKEAQKQIEFLAFHDPLTKLPNRLLVREHLEQAIFAAQRSQTMVALMFIDVDNFKTINDSLGHSIGDSLLKGIAIRLRECLREADTLSRQGGDEFLILLKDIHDTDSITFIAEKLLKRLAEPFLIEHHELAISLSIGVAVYPADGEDFDSLLKKSDTAMYQAKESGRNTYRFHTDQMNIDAVEHLRIRNGLRRALEQNEFVLHYQPQINIKTGAVIGAEALLRWNHPELGMVLPGRFISIAEDSGLIVPIGQWVLKEACQQAANWHEEGLSGLTMAVNLSAVQFKRGDVEKCVTQALALSGLHPALLELELTESILITDTEKVLSTVHKLKELGVKFSIDDFGTGYSSLSYLKQFDLDKIKIDQSFVRDMADDPNDAAIVKAIIQMAKSLNLSTIAEGVENERQLALLLLLDCDEVQGFYFARAMPAVEFVSYAMTRVPE